MKRYLFITFALLGATSLHAQTSKIYESGDYAVLPAFDAEEAAYRKVADAFEARDKQALPLLQDYLTEHPYTPYASEAHFMQGVLYAERNKNKKAIKELTAVKEEELSVAHHDAWLFYSGYANLKLNETVKALACFRQLKSRPSDFQLQATYYTAYCYYTQGNYDKALPDFLSIEHTRQYQHIVPYYIIQIYYAKGNYDEVRERAEDMINNDPTNTNNGEIHRILGEIYYHDGDYRQAKTHLGQYQASFAAQNREVLREDIYLLGMAHYQTGDMPAAIDYLKQVRALDDSISQNTQYHLGQAYMQTQQIEAAQMAYQAAMRMDIDKQLQEEAHYNYALTTYQSSSALGESVTAFTDFLQTYPQSKHKETVYELLCDVFLSSKNYQSALEALDQISQPTDKMLETKQYLRYQLAVDAFLQGKMPEAIDGFTSVITNRPQTLYTTDAYYWRAESHYRLDNYDATLADLTTFYQQPNVTQNTNYPQASYLKGYAQFQKKQYNYAQTSLLDYVENTDQSEPTYQDALNRIGDTYFNARDFSTAEQYYARVISLGKTGVDYATFQRGYVLGLMKRYSEKISQMESLVQRYPKSDYADDALYEVARAELQRDNNQAAIDAYTRLLNTYPNSVLSRKAYLEKAMIYYNMHKYDQAINAYKGVIQNYPGSDEAYAALEGLEACYVETNRVDEYLAYSKQLGKINMQSQTSEDSLTYAAAEKQYMQGNYQQAAKGLKTYVQAFCSGGRYCTQAQYFMADSYYRINDKAQALNAYQALAEISGNPYMEEALTRVAEIAYDQADYQTAQRYFSRLQKQAATTAKRYQARLGVLRCSYYLGDNETTIEIASEILEDRSIDNEVRTEARYNRGKAYYQLQRYGLAISDLRPLATEVRTQQGAESKYLIAECFYLQQDLEDAENEILSFAQMQTTQQYWLAKAFILLADINVARGEDFQAKQYLLSLQANYKVQDELQDIMINKLQQIQERETEKVEDDEDEL